MVSIDSLRFPSTVVRFRPSVNVGRRAKRQSATRGESCIPIGEARRCLQPRVRDHLAAGVERERPEKLPYGMVYVYLPTALELIAKINIHYCNYFLRRGRAEGATVISESARERGRQKERRDIIRKKEREREGDREEGRGARVFVKTEALVYICNESFIDVVVVPVAG